MRLLTSPLTRAAYLWNDFPNSAHILTTLEVFFGAKTGVNTLRVEKTWEYPEYVLELQLEDGKKLPKGSPRSRRG